MLTIDRVVWVACLVVGFVGLVLGTITSQERIMVSGIGLYALGTGLRANYRLDKKGVK